MSLRSSCKPGCRRGDIATACLILFLAGLGLQPASAQRGLKKIPDPDPAKQLETFTLAEGFEVSLYASDPMIAKPIQMNWDESGRLWIASSRTYPHIEVGAEARDQILVLDDRDADGEADHVDVFADNLLIPTGVLPGDGGAYVANSTELLHLSDRDGDGKADTERVVLSGFGTEDTHHILHTLRWGPDGCMYMNQSIYIHSHIETPHGMRRLMAGGVWRFRPESMELEVFNRGLINSWGHRIDSWGQSFQTDGAGGEGINYTFPGSVMRTAYQSKRTVPGLNPGQPKLCSLEIVDGRGIPEAWQDRLITCDFRGNRINSFALIPSDSGYVSQKKEDLIASSSVAFRPVDVSLGPDGAIYVADWYNPIIQHGEVDFRDKRRDRVHGRIWRIVAKGKSALHIPDLSTTEACIAALARPEGWSREQARRMLREKPDANALAAWKPESPRLRLEKLWAYQSMREVNAPLLRQLMNSPEPRVRAAAMRVLREWHDRIPGADALFEIGVRDKNAQVRLESLHGLRRRANALSTGLALSVLDQPLDDRLDFALWLTLRKLKPLWLPELLREPSALGSAEKMVYALRAVNEPDAVANLVQVWQDGQVAAKDEAAVLDLVAEMGGPKELEALFGHCLASPSPPLLMRLIQAASRPKGQRPAGDLNRLLPLLDHKDAVVRQEATLLAGEWKLLTARTKIDALAREGSDRGLKSLRRYGDGAARNLLRQLASEGGDLDLRVRSAEQLIGLNPKGGADVAVPILTQLQQVAPAQKLFRALLAHRQGPTSLLAALGDRKLSAAVAAEGIRQASSSGLKTGELIKALEHAGGLQPLAGKLTPEQMQALAAEVEGGSVERGETVYRRKSLLCITCHAIGGAGGKVGPDLTSIGASAPVDYIVDSLLDPGSKIKEGYHTTLITKKNGGVVSGVLLREGDGKLVLRDVRDQKQIVDAAEVARREIVPVSLMPPGLTGQLRRDELVDLVHFMSKLGKPDGLNPPNQTLVKNWRRLVGGKAVNDTVRHHGIHHAASGDQTLPWEKITSRVNGELPLRELERFSNIAAKNYFFVQFKVKALKEGVVLIRPALAKGLRIWQGITELKAGKEFILSVTPGEHVITVAVEENLRKGKGLLLELADAPGTVGVFELMPFR